MPSNGTGKELSALALLDIVRRRKWLVLIPAAVLLAAAGIYTVYQPPLYRAQALLGVEPGARSYVQTMDGSIARVQDQLLTIREVLFSRPVLEPVMRNFRLLPMPDGAISDTDLDRMRESIKITVEGDDSFHLAFEGRGRTQVMNVTNDLSERFIRRLASMRAQQVNEGAGLLTEELEMLQAQLNEQEQKLKVYKERSRQRTTRPPGNQSTPLCSDAGAAPEHFRSEGQRPGAARRRGRRDVGPRETGSPRSGAIHGEDLRGSEA